MNEGIKSYDEYKAQDLDAQFGDYVGCTEMDIPEVRKEAMRMLSEAIVIGMDIRGYKSVKPKWIEIPPALRSSDPLDSYGSLGGKINAKLTATKEQYNHYLYHFAKVALEDYHTATDKLKELETFGGFIKFKMKQLFKKGIDKWKQMRYWLRNIN